MSPIRDVFCGAPGSQTTHRRSSLPPLLFGAALLAACGSTVPARVVTVNGHQIEIATDGTGGAATVVYVKLLRRRGDGPSKELAAIEEEAERCRQVVEGLLDLTRPAAVDAAAVDVSTLARDVVDGFTTSQAADYHATRAKELQGK